MVPLHFGIVYSAWNCIVPVFKNEVPKPIIQQLYKAYLPIKKGCIVTIEGRGSSVFLY